MSFISSIGDFEFYLETFQSPNFAPLLLFVAITSVLGVLSFPALAFLVAG
jgi:hypothetical protein